jgi:hypothetical protein
MQGRGAGIKVVPTARAQQFLLSLPRGPHKQLDAEYQELLQDVVRPPIRECPANKWITANTWKLIDHRSMLHRKGMLSQTALHGLGRQIKAQLTANCQLHAANATSNIKGCLVAGEFVERWHYLKGWHRLAEDQAPKACPETLACQTAERVGLYMAVTPPGWEMHINVTPTVVHDEPPTDQEIRGVVGQLRNGCTVGAMGMKAEHLKEWLCRINYEESENRVAGKGDCWRLFVQSMQAVWESSTIPTQMSWMINVLLKKGGATVAVLACLTPCGRPWRKSW